MTYQWFTMKLTLYLEYMIQHQFTTKLTGETAVNDSSPSLVHREAYHGQPVVRARIPGIDMVHSIPTLTIRMLNTSNFEGFIRALNTSLALPRNFRGWRYRNALVELRWVNNEDSYLNEINLLSQDVIFEAVDQQEYNISLSHFINKLSDDCRARVIEGVNLVLVESRSNRELGAFSQFYLERLKVLDMI